MGKLIYFTPSSLDGYIADAPPYDWWVPDEAGMAAINDIHRPIGTYLYGRKEYETMAVWHAPNIIPGLTPVMQEFARIWQAADKIVFSRTLATLSAPSTRLERAFDVRAIRDLKARLSHDLSISGPTLAEHAIRAGLVDEYQLLVAPVLLGGGKSVFPSGARAQLELVDERRFPNGGVWLRYRARA